MRICFVFPLQAQETTTDLEQTRPPPAVVSIFLGDELTEVLKSIENDTYFTSHGAVQMDIGATVLPHFVKDNTDRNRTSPFAFTGNKFEFRMLGFRSFCCKPEYRIKYCSCRGTGSVCKGACRCSSGGYGACSS